MQRVSRCCYISLTGLVDLTVAKVEEFDNVVGFKYLRGMHLNDSKAALASNKDRHENIGMYVPIIIVVRVT